MEKEDIAATLCILLVIVLGVYMLVSVSETSDASYYDNTPIESRVNVTNAAPFVTQVNLYKQSDEEDTSIDLDEGTTTTLVCNATVNDLNGWSDIVSVNATIYDADSYSLTSPNDNNYHYFQGSCTNSSVNISAREFSCTFDVWYYANNATWNCSVSAIDIENATGSSMDLSPPTITALAALNLSTNLIDFGEMPPGNTTDDAHEQNVDVTNTGNVNINLSVDGYGAVDGDGLAMNCTQGNITISYLRYNITANQDFDVSMWNLTDDKLSSGIPKLVISQRVDDGDNGKVNSTNSTYWKLRIPKGVKGFCNGTVTFSAVV